MRILYFGVFDGKTWRSEYPMLHGLQKQGHLIYPVNFRQFLPGHIRRAFRRYHRRSDLVFIQNGNPFPSHWLARFECPVVYMASEFALSSAQHILDAPRPPDAVLAHSQQVVDYCLDKGIPVQRVHHAFHSQHYHVQHVPYTYDICFIGSLNARRERWLKSLQARFKERLFVGEVWQPEAINRYYNASKIVLHLHAAEENYVPTRFFEVLPTQGCLLTESLGNNLTPDLQFSGYRQFDTPESLLEHINDLLTHENLRQALVQQAQQQAPQHSWEGRMRTYSDYFKEVLHVSQTAHHSL